MSTMDYFLQCVRDEVAFARKKFPENDSNYAALVEEVGELAKALMEESSTRIHEEAVQVASAALRVATEGDPSFKALRKKNGADKYSSES